MDEHELLKELLYRYNLDNVSNSYIKVSSYEYGISLVKNIKNFKNIDFAFIIFHPIP